jgi:hypothetical protein
MCVSGDCRCEFHSSWTSLSSQYLILTNPVEVQRILDCATVSVFHFPVAGGLLAIPFMSPLCKLPVDIFCHFSTVFWLVCKSYLYFLSYNSSYDPTCCVSIFSHSIACLVLSSLLWINWSFLFINVTFISLCLCSLCFSFLYYLKNLLSWKTILIPVCRKQLKMLKRCSAASLVWRQFTVVSMISPVNTTKQLETTHLTTKMLCGFWAVLTSRIYQVTRSHYSSCHIGANYWTQLWGAEGRSLLR